MTNTDKMIRFYEKKQSACMKYLCRSYGSNFMEHTVYKPQVKPGFVSYCEFGDRSVSVFYPKRNTPKEVVQDYEADFIESLRIQQDRDDDYGIRCIRNIIEDIKKCKILHVLIRYNLLLNAYIILKELQETGVPENPKRLKILA